MLIMIQSKQNRMNNNSFFQRNTIKDWTSDPPVELRQRSKRAFSVTALRMDPSKFQHREVFDARLYEKSNLFKLDLQELKQKEQAKGFTPSRDLNKVINALVNIFHEQTLLQGMTNFNNHCALMLKSDAKKQFIQTMTGIVVSLLRRIQSKSEEIVNSKKEAELKIAEFESTITKLKRQSAKLIEESQKGKRGDRQRQLRQTNSQLDFNLKREMLKVDSLQEKVRDQGKALQVLTQKLQKLQAERQAQASYRQSMQYKVRRLKQQLQVAHILKQQNLADKMKYIMNW